MTTTWRLIDPMPVALLIAALDTGSAAGPTIGRCRRVNRRFGEQLGYDCEDIGQVRSWLERACAHDRRAPVARLDRLVRAAAARTLRVQLLRKDGRARWFDIDAARCEDAGTAHCALAFTDVTERVRIGRRLQRLGRCDALTGVLTRQSLIARHAEVFAADAVGYGLLLCEIEGLRRLNERCGHAAGDAALADCARQLRRRAGAGALIGRWDGDRFAVLVPACTPVALRQRAQTLMRAVGGTAADRSEAAVSLSIGAACAAAGTPLGAAARRATGALAFGRSAGRGRIELD
ncbi:MAG TPA: diguanylate cyclase [Dokdonella sp.]|uniref:GGDEF domain-containing protein n=1 Tax=Dokdonella sp. TaxID=2291710 RepID=UPI002D09D86A|nr:diguanylate cyclase [Dokdonella sp.]HUD43119.1 diguanylate cyclase [Dokdonella sp.]